MTKLIATASVAALLAANPAFAGDIYSKGSTKDGEMQIFQPTEGVVNFSGFYIGGALGYGNSNHNLSVRDFFKDYCYGNTLATPQAPLSFGSGKDAFDRHNDGVPPGADGTCDTTSSYKNLVPGDSREDGSIDGVNASGLVGDVRVGYDRTFGRFLGGIYGSYGFSDMSATATGIDGDSKLSELSLEKGDEWSIGLRAGYIVAPRTLAYILAAYTQTEYTFGGIEGRGKDAKSFSKDTSFDGITVGGGIEFALAANVFFGIEGTHTFYGSETIYSRYNEDKNIGTSIEDELGETRVLGTLKIKLDPMSR